MDFLLNTTCYLVLYHHVCIIFKSALLHYFLFSDIKKALTFVSIVTNGSEICAAKCISAEKKDYGLERLEQTVGANKVAASRHALAVSLSVTHS